jgi:transposase
MSNKSTVTVATMGIDMRRLDERIQGLSDEIEAVAHQDLACERLMTVPGIGPIISSDRSVLSESAQASPHLRLRPNQ